MSAPELRYTDRDVREDGSLVDLAQDYLRRYTGEFAFLVDLQEALVTRGRPLTVANVRGVLNCMRNDPRVCLTLPSPRFTEPEPRVPRLQVVEEDIEERRPRYKVEMTWHWPVLVSMHKGAQVWHLLDPLDSYLEVSPYLRQGSSERVIAVHLEAVCGWRKYDFVGSFQEAVESMELVAEVLPEPPEHRRPCATCTRLTDS